MNIELSFGSRNNTKQIPLSRYDVEYFQQLRNPSEPDIDSFRVTLSDNDLDVNIDYVPITEAAKVNALAEKIQNLDEAQTIFYLEFTNDKQPQTIDEFIRIANSVNDLMWIPIYSKKELGEFLLECDFFEAPDSIIHYLDAEKVAEKWLRENSNTSLTGNGYFEDNRTEEQKHAPVQVSTKEFEQFDHAFFITDISKDGKAVQVKFPCMDEELDAALKEIGAENGEDCEITNIKCRYQALDDFSDYESYSLEQQQKLSKTLFPLSTAEFQKLQAVAEMHFAFVQDGHFYDGNQEVAVITDTAQTLNQYEFYPPATKWNDIVAEQFRKQNPELYEEFKDCIDYRKAESDGLINNKVVIAPSGYVVCTNQDALAQTQKILEPDPPAIQQVNEGMGGMSGMNLR